MNWDTYMHELVKVIAMKSKDPSTQVGCVITTKDHQILFSILNLCSILNLYPFNQKQT